MYTDFVLNGEGHGSVGSVLSGVRFDPGLLRPYLVYESGRNIPYVTINSGRTVYDDKSKSYVPQYVAVKIEDLNRIHNIYSPVQNATSLRKEDWIAFDTALVRAYRPRLRAYGDLLARSRFGGFNAMSKMTLEYEAMSDPGEASVSMDGLATSGSDAPLFKLRSIPLPITHSDFYFSQRLLMQSRNSGTPLDTAMIEAAGRRIAESIEKTFIGVETGPAYGAQTAGITAHDTSLGSQVYGMINYPHRLTVTNLTVPTGSNPNQLVDDVIEDREFLYASNCYGPFMVYHSTDWDNYLDKDYAFTNGSNWATNPNMTVRDRIRKIDGIEDVKRLDYLTAANSHAFTRIMIQMSPEVVQAIDGLAPTVVQWESHGGMRLNFKILAIQLARFRSDYNGVCALLHSRTA